MMSKAARFVFLSATIPNAREFAEWIATIHRCEAHAVHLLCWPETCPNLECHISFFRLVHEMPGSPTRIRSSLPKQGQDQTLTLAVPNSDCQ